MGSLISGSVFLCALLIVVKKKKKERSGVGSRALKILSRMTT